MKPQPLPYDFRRAAYGLRLSKDLSDDDAAEVRHHFGVDAYVASLAVASGSVEQPRSYLYLLQTETTQDRYFKIGMSIKPHVRLGQIQSGKGANMPDTWEGQPVGPLALRLGGRAIEASIHRDLHEFRVPRTEWFVAKLAVSHYIVGQDAWNSWQGEAPTLDDFTPED